MESEIFLGGPGVFYKGLLIWAWLLSLALSLKCFTAPLEKKLSAEPLPSSLCSLHWARFQNMVPILMQAVFFFCTYTHTCHKAFGLSSLGKKQSLKDIQAVKMHSLNVAAGMSFHKALGVVFSTSRFHTFRNML